jgi:hypothetical protein
LRREVIDFEEIHMASTLTGGGTRDRTLNKGHGTSALGPSDTSDSGSDITGGPGLVEGDVIGLDAGTSEDPDTGGRTAGQDLGDANLDSDSDSVGTGEHATAGRELRTPPDADRLPDRIEQILPDTEEVDGDERESR